MRFNKYKAKIKSLLSMRNSSVEWGHLGNFDLEPNFPTNPMGSSGPLWARCYFP